MDIQQSSMEDGVSKIIIDGKTYISPKMPFGKGNVLVSDGDHIYINYYELKNGEWKRTFKAFIKCFFC